MREFDEPNKPQENEKESYFGENEQSTPIRNNSNPNADAYYQPKNNNDTPPGTYGQNPNPQNTTYHYSYQNNTKNGAEQNTSQYTAPQNPASEKQPWETADDDKKKKNKKTVIVIVCIAIVCVVIGIVGIALTSAGIIGSIETKDDDSSVSDNISDTQTQDSNGAATKDKSGALTVAGVADKCIDSCVGITVYSNQSNPYNNFFGYGAESDENGSRKSGEGSGIIMREEGGKTYIITCAHVISDGDSFKVTFNDGNVYDAKMVGYDSQTDIGVLSIDKTGFSVANFAKSEQLAVGEQVVAIGCPGGLEFMNSVTSGYVSALGRPIESSTIGYDNECIQTDAAINPGNSGGALFNMQGQVVGINSSKIASAEYEGMGFAVPSSTAIDTANSLIRVGYVEGRAKLGITYTSLSGYSNSTAIVKALAEKGYKDAMGAMVINEVAADSDLANKDIKQYDMIIAIEGKVLTSTDILTSVLSDSKPGDTVKLTIARIDNNEIKTFDVNCKLIENKGE